MKLERALCWLLATLATCAVTVSAADALQPLDVREVKVGGEIGLRWKNCTPPPTPNFSAWP